LNNATRNNEDTRLLLLLLLTGGGAVCCQVENVLVGKNGALYLIDFGSATVVTYDTDKVP
jgi:hypothetical protein